MKVVIIGTGNVATVLGKKMKSAGVEILQVYGRNEMDVRLLAKDLSASSTSNLLEINKDADIYLLAISDTYISSVASKLRLKNKIIVHTAGSVSRDTLISSGTSSCTYGVIYPMQSMKKENVLLPPVPVLVDGSDTATTQLLSKFSSMWSENVALADDDQRLKMHIASVIVSNFTTFMYVLADDFCMSENLDFKMLLPLINETVERLKHHRPAEVQTGPAVRKDIQTINLHIDVLSKYPRLQGMYKVISANILDQ
jgi:predicted short-subunit dehydrogenase-like oxidoreductase (DUF2520 family)